MLETVTPDDGRLLTWTDWDGYLKILDVFSERRLRITYQRGTLEIVSPSILHEVRKSLLRQLIECLFMEREVDFRSGGATTFKRSDLEVGLEPDECYWIANWRAVRGEYSIQTGPPPDLVIEVEVSRTALSRMPIYRDLRVPEVWRFRASQSLEVWCLVGHGDYAQQPRSSHFPDIDPADLTRFVSRGESQEISTSRLLREFRVWLAAQA